MRRACPSWLAIARQGGRGRFTTITTLVQAHWGRGLHTGGSLPWRQRWGSVTYSTWNTGRLSSGKAAMVARYQEGGARSRERPTIFVCCCCCCCCCLFYFGSKDVKRCYHARYARKPGHARWEGRRLATTRALSAGSREGRRARGRRGEPKGRRVSVSCERSKSIVPSLSVFNRNNRFQTENVRR